MESITLPALLLGIILIAGVSKRVRNTIITLPMLYTLFGLLVALLFSDRINITYDNPLVELIATLTLILVLATDASRISMRNVLRFHDLPLRLLGFGLPLTIALGAVLAALIFGAMSIWEAAILAVILAPTDASLGQSVVDNVKAPARIRQALNIESGLNDGIAMPFLLLFIALAVAHDTSGPGFFLTTLLSQIGFGVLVGAALGYVSAKYLQWGQTSGWMSANFQKLALLSLVFLTYWLAEQIGGNGYIASFSFGIASGNAISRSRGQAVYQFGKVEYTLLMLLTYTIFGMALLLPALEKMTPTIVLYALLSLTVVRMLPVALSLIGTKLLPITDLFMGWFGPRGIASIIYVIMVLNTDGIGQKETIYTVGMVTVFFSILLHGISAAPLSGRYGDKIAKLAQSGGAKAETESVPELPTRTQEAPAKVA